MHSTAANKLLTTNSLVTIQARASTAFIATAAVKAQILVAISGGQIYNFGEHAPYRSPNKSMHACFTC